MLRTDAQSEIVHAHGELDIAAAPAFMRMVCDALKQCRGSMLVVDLHECTFIDSTAVGALVDLRAIANRHGIELRLGRTPPPIARVLALLGLTGAFGLATDVPAADSAAQRAELRARAARARTVRREQGAELQTRTSDAAELMVRMADDLAEARDRIRNLEIALQTNRRIGQALGIVMERFKVTEEVAFDALRTASQHNHCKLREVAEHVVQTGEIPTAA